MPAGRSPLGHADDRPRVHIWPGADGHRISFGPVATRSRQAWPTPGAALDAAFMHLGAQVPAVAIVEPANG